MHTSGANEERTLIIHWHEQFSPVSGEDRQLLPEPEPEPVPEAGLEFGPDSAPDSGPTFEL
jgi:hypothetical protein